MIDSALLEQAALMSYDSPFIPKISDRLLIELDGIMRVTTNGEIDRIFRLEPR